MNLTYPTRRSLPCRILLLLISVITGLNASALESDDINAAILVEGKYSIPVRWNTAEADPWYLQERTDGTAYLCSPEKDKNEDTSHSISFSYTSTYPVELSFQYLSPSFSSSDSFEIYVDDALTLKITSGTSSWTKKQFIVEPGSHKIELRYNNYYCSHDIAIQNLRVWECRNPEDAFLVEGSLPLTFENDSANLWIGEDGYLRSQAVSGDDAETSITTTFTIDKPSLFGFQYQRTDTYTSSSIKYGLTTYVDGESIYDAGNGGRDWSDRGVVLQPGTHTVKFVAFNEPVHIRNVRLVQDWYDITVTTPGELGRGLIQALGDKRLQDTELLKIRGSINASDWATIGQLTGIRAVDFTETDITEIPASAFLDRSTLSTVMLPNTVEKIGENAFSSTGLYQLTLPASLKRIEAAAFRKCRLKEVTIPTSVEYIGQEAWYASYLRHINFEEDSQLTTIGGYAFAYSNIEEFIMPNSVRELPRHSSWGGYHTFSSCKYLKKLTISTSLTTIPRGFAYECSSLEEIIIPENILTMDDECFRFCASLKRVVLNSHCNMMDEEFYGCGNIETIVLPCATPPSINRDPFGSITKSRVDLIVPDFAYDAYKLDPYWYQFTNSHSGDEASLREKWSIHGSLHLDPTHIMRQSPSVSLEQGSAIIVDSETPQEFNVLSYNTSESNPACFLNNSESVSANELKSFFYIDTKDKWYFFSPVADVNMADVSFSGSDSWVIRYYDGARRASENAASGNWINVPADGVLHRGQGYIFRANATGWLHLPAPSAENVKQFLNQKETAFELADNPCETAANAGWNFISNPYPTYYDIYYIDMQAPITVWTGTTYRALSLNDGDRGTDTYLLRPMQPFFVQKGSPDLTISMPLTGRQTNTVIDRTRAPKRAAQKGETRHLLNLEIAAAGSEEADDYTRIVINEKAGLDYEPIRDASKFMSLNTEVAQLYTLDDSNLALAINERPYASGSVRLGVYTPVAGATYRISSPRCDRKAWIHDAQTGLQQELEESGYLFTSTRKGYDNNRFTISFAPITVGTEEIPLSGVTVRGIEGAVSITTPGEAEIAIYGADGRVAASQTVGSGETTVAAAPGLYIVKVNGESCKVIVR